MKNRACIAILIALTGCALSPKKPPNCTGELQPINPDMMTQEQLNKGQKHHRRSHVNDEID